MESSKFFVKRSVLGLLLCVFLVAIFVKRGLVLNTTPGARKYLMSNFDRFLNSELDYGKASVETVAVNYTDFQSEKNEITKKDTDTGLLILVLGGGSKYYPRMEILKRTWLDEKVDWGVNFRAFVFTNFAAHKKFRMNQGHSKAFPGEVLHDCNESFKKNKRFNKCCLRARQIRFLIDYYDEWPEMQWVVFLDDDQYPVLPNMLKGLKKAEEEQANGGALAIGISGCQVPTCRGFCGGGGIYVNRKWVKLFKEYSGNGLGKGSLEQWFLEKCEVCEHWADLTFTEFMHDIERQQYEKTLYLGSRISRSVEVDFNKIPEQHSRQHRLPGLYYLPSRNDEMFKKALEDEEAVLHHYDFRKHTHLIHQTILGRHAISYDGVTPAPKTLPEFKSMQEAEKEFAKKESSDLAKEKSLEKDKNKGEDSHKESPKKDKDPIKKPLKEEQAKEEQAKEEQAKEEQAKEEQAKEEQAKEEQAREEQAKEEQAKEEQAKEEQAKEEQAKEEQAKEEQAKEEQAREEAPGKVESSSDVNVNV